MEKRLQEYRRLKAEKLGVRSGAVQQKERSTVSSFDDLNSERSIDTKDDVKSKADSGHDEQKFKETMKMIDSKRKASQSLWERYNLETILKALLWLCLLGFFIQVGFAIVYLIISLSYFMYASMRSGSRKTGPSAYSVFNDGCERIDGTFTAEQFENQMRHGTIR